MKTIMRFIKPYKWLCFVTLLVMFLDVAGGLLIPTITADMINAGINGENMDYLIRSGILMLIVTVITSLGALLGSYFAADLSSKIGRDMRNALYDKSLAFSSYDFEQFGTGSMITRTPVSYTHLTASYVISDLKPRPLKNITLPFTVQK